MKKYVNSMYFLAIISKISIVIFSIFSIALINRLLGPTMKGEYAYICNYVNITVIIFSFGIGQTYSEYRRKYGNKLLNLFISLTIVQSIFCLLLYIIFKLFFNISIISQVLLVTSFSILSNNILYIVSVEDIKKRDRLNILYKLIYFIIITIIFLLNIKSINLLLISLIINDIIILIGSFYKYNLKFDFSILKKEKINLKQIYIKAFFSMIALLMISLNYSIDIIILKSLSTSYYIGLYSVGVNLSNLLWLIPDAFKDIIFHKTARDDSIKQIVTLTKYCMYISIVLIILFIIGGKLFISLLYGSDYINSYFVTIILFVGCLSMIIYKLIHPLYISKGKQNIIITILSISVIINLILNYILIPQFNMYGAAIASVISYSICSMIFLIKFSKDYNVNIKNFIFLNKNDYQIINKFLKKGSGKNENK